MASSKPVPGIMTVNSDVIKLDQLTKKDFDDWYCDEHIPDVVAKSGVEAAYRYEHIKDGNTPERRLGFLTIYRMPDIKFMDTKEFKSLEGQSPGPSRERIFEKSEFDTRSYELVQVNEAPGAPSGPAPFLIYAAINHKSDSELDTWYREEHIPLIAKCSGYRRTSRYKIATNSLLSEFKRSFPEAPTWLTIHEFGREEIPWKELSKANETEWTKRMSRELEMSDVGGWELKRVFRKKGE